MIAQKSSPARQTRDKIREIERLNPGKKVILAPADPGARSRRRPPEARSSG